MSNEQSELAAIREQLENLCDRFETIEKLLLGEGGKFGIAHQVNVLWRVHIWVACTLSAIAGATLKAGLDLMR